MNTVDAEKIFLNKVKRLNTIKKIIKVDKQNKFYQKIFNLLYNLNNLVNENFDFCDEFSSVKFRINLYTNVDLVLFSQNLSGYTYGISSFSLNNKNERFYTYEDEFYEINDIDKLKLYFQKNYVKLPSAIEIIELKIICNYQKKVIEYNIKN